MYPICHVPQSNRVDPNEAATAAWSESALFGNALTDDSVR